MLGYSYNSSMEGDFIDTTISSHHDYTHISVFVTIEPPLKQPEPALDRVCSDVVTVFKLTRFSNVIVI